jgi:hypothetical protein
LTVLLLMSRDLSASGSTSIGHRGRDRNLLPACRGS